MTATEFRDRLHALKLRQSWLAERLGVNTSTVNRWATGRKPVPEYAVFALDLLLGLSLYVPNDSHHWKGPEKP